MVNCHFFERGVPEKSSALCLLEVGFLSIFKIGKPRVFSEHSILTGNPKISDKNCGIEEEKMGAAPAQCAVRFRAAIEVGAARRAARNQARWMGFENGEKTQLVCPFFNKMGRD